MRCPECQYFDSKVVDSRPMGDAIRRRRECMRCNARFTTHERLEQRVLWVVKKDDRREPFSREKVERGIALACRKRPVDAAAIEAAVQRVEARLAEVPTNGAAGVTSGQVGEAVMGVLRELDPVAYVRFASVYQAFESVEQFAEAIVQVTAAPVARESAPAGDELGVERR